MILLEKEVINVTLVVTVISVNLDSLKIFLSDSSQNSFVHPHIETSSQAGTMCLDLPNLHMSCCEGENHQ